VEETGAGTAAGARGGAHALGGAGSEERTGGSGRATACMPLPISPEAMLPPIALRACS
jgi:hypothetical protein